MALTIGSTTTIFVFSLSAKWEFFLKLFYKPVLFVCQLGVGELGINRLESIHACTELCVRYSENSFLVL